MSIIIEDNGVYKMYVKGADNVIKDRLHKTFQHPFLENAVKKLYDFSTIGLRTLLIAMKVLSKEELLTFQAKFDECSKQKNKDEELDKLAEEYE